MAIAGDISQITLPSGSTYNIKDAAARAAINGTFVIAWNGASTPTVANIPAGVKVTYNSTEYTGTLAANDTSGTSTLGKFYLVKSSSQQNPTLLDIYDEYVTVDNGSGANPRYTWEKIGDTQIKLSEIVTGVTPTTSKLVTTSVTGVSGSVTASKVSAATSQTTAKGTGTSSTSTDAWLKGWGVSGEVLTISGVTMDTQTTTQVNIDTASVTVPKAATSSTTVATGSVASNGGGATVVTGVTADH